MSETQANLCSGGLDSYLVWKLFAPSATNVYVRIGHKYQDGEVRALELLREHDPAFSFRACDGPHLGALETPSGIIPCRNALLLLTAAAWVGSRPGVRAVSLLLGALAEEINSDKSEEFCAAMEQVLDVSWRGPQYWTEGVSFRVLAPARGLTKTGLIRAYADGGGVVGLLRHTRSCYAVGQAHCGDCAACFKRWVGFAAAGLADPTDYLRAPWRWTGAAEARRKALDGTYGPRRAAETLSALEAA